MWNAFFAGNSNFVVKNYEIFEIKSESVKIMAGFLSKSKELLRLIPDLQCLECKNVPGPNENQANRYSCTNASHILCEQHKKRSKICTKYRNH